MKKYRFLLFQKMLTSAVLLRFKANYLGKLRGYPQFYLWIPIALAKKYFSAWSYSGAKTFAFSRHRPQGGVLSIKIFISKNLPTFYHLAFPFFRVLIEQYSNLS